MKNTFRLVTLLLALLTSPLTTLADETGNERIMVQLVLDQTTVQPPDNPGISTVRIGVLLKIQAGWHTYWRNSGQAAIPTKVSWQLPTGWTAGELQWPAPTKFIEKGDIVTYGYQDEVLLWADLYPPQVIPSEGQQETLSTKVSWLVCSDICVPGTQTAELALPFSTSLPSEASAAYPLFKKYAGSTPLRTPAQKAASPLKELKVQAFQLSPKQGLLVIDKLPLLNADVSELFQVFPYHDKVAGAEAADIKVSETEAQALLKFPLSHLPNLSEPRKGIVVIAAQLLKSETDLSLEWSLDSTAPTPAVQTALDTSPTFLKLEFRAGHTGGTTPASSPPRSVVPVNTGGLFHALLAAFVAGMLLNLMPCVLPIISIKIMGFVTQGNLSRGEVLKSSLWFAAGILASFLVLAGILISLRTLGFSLGWGFQFQYPGFVAALLLIVFLLSLALFDFYSVNLPFMQSADKAASRVTTPHLRHFFDGVLATLLSTPCTAPILGTALVFAFSQPPVWTVLIFLTIGSGLALPYVYCSTHPAMLKRLPKPGNWMNHFRQVMGFLLLGTCVWLLSVLHDLTYKGAVWAMLLLLLCFFVIWLRKVLTESNYERGSSAKFNAVFFIALGTAILCLYPLVTARKGEASEGLIHWTDFHPSVVEQAVSENRPVFIDFTASWCITCKFNEYRIIETQETKDALAANGVMAVKADWTSGDEAITAALKSYGAEGVPLYVILPAGRKEPIVLSTLPSQASLIEALEKAK